VSGAAIGFNWIFLFQSYRFAGVAVGTITYYFAPVFVMVLSPLILKERLSALRLACILAAFAGLFLVVRTGSEQDGQRLKGVLFGLCAAALYTAVILLNKRLSDISGEESACVQLPAVALSLSLYVLLFERPHGLAFSPLPLVLLAVVGFVHTGVAYNLYFSSMLEIPAQSIAALSYIDPVVSILLSVAVLREKLTLPQAAGCALILGATFLGESASGKGKG